ncbi:MAG: trypsin-like peptidase domain-containing protein [Myxococcaceae bacterium]|nr:trypsin-like peptidase domain-containing protein [Myxococcaceae bacterium]
MRVVVLTLLVAAPATADELRDWARAKVRAQREGLEARTAEAPAEPDEGGAPTAWRERTIIPFWKERLPGGPSLVPSFTPPASLAPLVRAVRAGVVNLSTKNEGPSKSLGSGFLITADGLVVTNHHVIERAQSIVCRLADGRAFGASVVGRDAETDLALLRLDGAADLPTVTLGDSDQLEVGDWVVAIGNPFGLDTSVTHGLVSARERIIGVGPFDDFLQIDALINPGNSGGPIFDLRGYVIGVTSAVMSQGQGVGFAVPINLVKDLLPNLRDQGTPVRGWLGVTIAELRDGAPSDAVVAEVYPGSPAARGGIRVGDRLVSVNGRPVDRYQQLLRRIAVQGPGVMVRLGVLRDGKALTVQALLSARPAAGPAPRLEGRVDGLGLVLAELEPGPGMRVEAVDPGGVAEAAGLAVGDVVVEVNRTPCRSLGQMQALVAGAPAGEAVLLKVTRKDASRYVALKRRG